MLVGCPHHHIQCRSGEIIQHVIMSQQLHIICSCSLLQSCVMRRPEANSVLPVGLAQAMLPGDVGDLPE